LVLKNLQDDKKINEEGLMKNKKDLDDRIALMEKA